MTWYATLRGIAGTKFAPMSGLLFFCRSNIGGSNITDVAVRQRQQRRQSSTTFSNVWRFLTAIFSDEPKREIEENLLHFDDLRKLISTEMDKRIGKFVCFVVIIFLININHLWARTLKPQSAIIQQYGYWYIGR